MHPSAPLLVVVTGPPGAGKTTVAEALRAQLSLPLVAKDTLKETLGEALAIIDRHESRRLGIAVLDLVRLVVRELLAARVSLIVEGNFSVTTTLFDSLPAARIVQVHVTASPEIVRTRLLERDAHRHPVHYDREAADEIAERTRAGEWAPLHLEGTLLHIDTTVWPDLAPLLATIGP
jgi:broad-specificity NMP kinase